MSKTYNDDQNRGNETNQGGNNRPQGGNGKQYTAPKREVRDVNISTSTKQLLRTTIDIDPIGAFYNIDTDTVQKFTVEYFNALGISGVHSAGFKIIRDGREKPNVQLFAFFKEDSDDIIDNLGNIPKHVRKNMQSEGFRPTETLKRALHPVTKHKEMGKIDNIVFVKLDIFKILGFMLDVSRDYKLSIVEVTRLSKNTAVLSIVKMENFGTDAPQKSSTTERLLARI